MVAVALVLGTLISGALGSPINAAEIARRALPVGISVSTATTYLSQLTVGTPSNSPPYKRDYFHIWTTVNGRCDTRETVLKRDGTNVVTDVNCVVTSGRWVSPYDGVATNLATDLDIDHVVPLKEAWISGARSWTPSRREQFANDLTRPQLVAVTDNLNQAKSDQDPSTWLPPLNSFKCTYAVAWIQVKNHYGLIVNSAEKTALTNTLNTYC